MPSIHQKHPKNLLTKDIFYRAKAKMRTQGKEFIYIHVSEGPKQHY